MAINTEITTVQKTELPEELVNNGTGAARAWPIPMCVVMKNEQPEELVDEGTGAARAWPIPMCTIM
jgi:hypothetical protein